MKSISFTHLSSLISRYQHSLSPLSTSIRIFLTHFNHSETLHWRFWTREIVKNDKWKRHEITHFLMETSSHAKDLDLLLANPEYIWKVLISNVKINFSREIIQTVLPFRRSLIHLTLITMNQSLKYHRGFSLSPRVYEKGSPIPSLHWPFVEITSQIGSPE